MNTISRQDAIHLIDTYCADEPRDDAVERLIAIEISSLAEQEGNDWIQITGSLGMKQDALDAILYDE